MIKIKSRLLILILLVISITIPVTSFAEHPVQTEKPQDNFHKGTIEWVIHCNIGRVYSSTVRVIDYDMNQDSEKIEQFNIEVWSDHEDRIVDYTVTETGNNTGIFDVTIFYKTTDESSGGRIRAVPDSIVFVKYVDYTLPDGATENDIIDTFVKSELPASGWRDGDMWKITYDPCMIEYLDKNKNSLDWFNIFYPAPLKQIKSGLHMDEIQCKESLILVTKHDGSPACVKPETISKLIERNWTIQSIVQDIIFKTMSKNLGPECEQNTMDDILSGIVDEKCSKFMDELVNEHHSEMMQRGYSFDQEKNSWVKDGYPDVMMSIVDSYQQNLKIVESELQLYNAKKLLESAYYENVNLGPLKINDVIVGFGIENDMLIIDVLYRYSTSSEMDIVKKKIRNIVGDEIKIEYIPYKESSRFIQKALVYHWNEYLHKNNIEFAPAYPSHGNNDDGIGDGTFLCSPLVSPNGTEFYIVSTVIVESFLITDTFVDIEKPEFCRKTWKTDVILEEPDRVILLWLEMGQGKIPN